MGAGHVGLAGSTAGNGTAPHSVNCLATRVCRCEDERHTHHFSLALFPRVRTPRRAADLPGDKTSEFVNMGTVPVVNDRFTLAITVDSMYTLTTLKTLNKGTFATPPAPVYFPSAWTDNFDACPLSSEPAFFADQNG